MNKKELNIKCFGVRNFVPSAVDKDKRTISLIASSETPYLRYDCDLGPYFEILSHKPENVDLTRLLNKAPYLFEHDPENQIGVIEDVNIMNKQLLAKVRFSKNQFPDEVFNDVVDGIRNKNSMGYFVSEGEIIGYDEETGYPIIEVKWSGFEISSVAIPADDTAIILRSISKEDQKRSIKIVMKKDLVEKIDGDVVIEVLQGNTPAIITDSTIEPVVEVIEPVNEVVEPVLEPVVEIVDQIVDNQNLSDKITSEQHYPVIQIVDNEIKTNQNINKNGVRKMDIQALLKKADTFSVKSEVVTEFLRSGKTEEEFDDFVKEQNKTKTQGTRNMDQLGLNVNDSEINQYDFFRAIDAKLTGKKTLETEISDEIAKRTGQNPDGILLPLSYLKKAASKSALTRAYNSGSGDASGAENLVAQILDASSFVDILRHQLVVARLGVKTVGGLVGDYAIPRKVSGSSNTWVGDSGASTESSAVFDKVVSKPKMLVSETQLFELARRQMTPDAQYLAVDDMLKARAVELDRVVLWGTGINNQPTGVANTAGVASLALGANGGAITRSALIDLMAALGNVDANVDNARYVTNFKVKAALMKLASDVGSGIFVWDEFKELFAVTNNIPSNLTKGTGTGLSGMIFGDFSDVVVTEWGSPEMIVDGLTQAKYGKLNLYMRQATDVLVKRPASFAVIKDIT